MKVLILGGNGRMGPKPVQPVSMMVVPPAEPSPTPPASTTPPAVAPPGKAKSAPAR